MITFSKHKLVKIIAMVVVCAFLFVDIAWTVGEDFRESSMRRQSPASQTKSNIIFNDPLRSPWWNSPGFKMRFQTANIISGFLLSLLLLSSGRLWAQTMIPLNHSSENIAMAEAANSRFTKAWGNFSQRVRGLPEGNNNKDMRILVDEIVMKPGLWKTMKELKAASEVNILNGSLKNLMRRVERLRRMRDEKELDEYASLQLFQGLIFTAVFFIFSLLGFLLFTKGRFRKTFITAHLLCFFYAYRSIFPPTKQRLKNLSHSQKIEFLYGQTIKKMRQELISIQSSI